MPDVDLDIFDAEAALEEDGPICGHLCFDIIEWEPIGECNLDPDHKGRHTTSAWRCKGCGKKRRSSAYTLPGDDGAYCFMCASPQMKRKESRS